MYPLLTINTQCKTLLLILLFITCLINILYKFDELSYHWGSWTTIDFPSKCSIDWYKALKHISQLILSTTQLIHVFNRSFSVQLMSNKIMTDVAHEIT